MGVIMQCDFCGKIILDSSCFCVYCGKKLKEFNRNTIEQENQKTLEELLISVSPEKTQDISIQYVPEPKPMELNIDEEVSNETENISESVNEKSPTVEIPVIKDKINLQPQVLNIKELPEVEQKFNNTKEKTIELPKNMLPLRTAEFFGFGLLMLIPIVNIILCIVWSFSDKVNINKKNISRACLIMFGSVLFITLLVLLFILFTLVGSFEFSFVWGF